MLEELAGLLTTEYGVSILCGYPHSFYEQNDTNLISGIYQTPIRMCVWLARSFPFPSRLPHR